jgi:L-cysteine:1D-myo-inositol 2-amino-2-deoxy-alpha-D-glucopyranoside ligase
MSAAQVKAITGQTFASAYVHTGMIGLDGEKMSKSKGNLVFVSTSLAHGIDPMVIRYALMKGHYASDRMWDSIVLKNATEEIARIRYVLSRIEVAPTEDLINSIAQSLASNLNTPEALTSLMSWVDESEQGITGGSVGEIARALDSLLGLTL